MENGEPLNVIPEQNVPSSFMISDKKSGQLLQSAIQDHQSTMMVPTSKTVRSFSTNKCKSEQVILNTKNLNLQKLSQRHHGISNKGNCLEKAKHLVETSSVDLLDNIFDDSFNFRQKQRFTKECMEGKGNVRPRNLDITHKLHNKFDGIDHKVTFEHLERTQNILKSFVDKGSPITSYHLPFSKKGLCQSQPNVLLETPTETYIDFPYDSLKPEEGSDFNSLEYFLQSSATIDNIFIERASQFGEFEHGHFKNCIFDKSGLNIFRHYTRNINPLGAPIFVDKHWNKSLKKRAKQNILNQSLRRCINDPGIINRGDFASKSRLDKYSSLFKQPYTSSITEIDCSSSVTKQMHHASNFPLKRDVSFILPAQRCDVVHLFAENNDIFKMPIERQGILNEPSMRFDAFSVSEKICNALNVVDKTQLTPSSSITSESKYPDLLKLLKEKYYSTYKNTSSIYGSVINTFPNKKMPNGSKVSLSFVEITLNFIKNVEKSEREFSKNQLKKCLVIPATASENTTFENSNASNSTQDTYNAQTFEAQESFNVEAIDTLDRKALDFAPFVAKDSLVSQNQITSDSNSLTTIASNSTPIGLTASYSAEVCSKDIYSASLNIESLDSALQGAKVLYSTPIDATTSDSLTSEVSYSEALDSVTSDSVAHGGIVSNLNLLNATASDSASPFSEILNYASLNSTASDSTTLNVATSDSTALTVAVSDPAQRDATALDSAPLIIAASNLSLQNAMASDSDTRHSTVRTVTNAEIEIPAVTYNGSSLHSSNKLLVADDAKSQFNENFQISEDTQKSLETAKEHLTQSLNNIPSDPLEGNTTERESNPSKISCSEELSKTQRFDEYKPVERLNSDTESNDKFDIPVYEKRAGKGEPLEFDKLYVETVPGYVLENPRYFYLMENPFIYPPMKDAKDLNFNLSQLNSLDAASIECSSEENQATEEPLQITSDAEIKDSSEVTEQVDQAVLISKQIAPEINLSNLEESFIVDVPSGEQGTLKISTPVPKVKSLETPSSTETCEIQVPPLTKSIINDASSQAQGTLKSSTPDSKVKQALVRLPSRATFENQFPTSLETLFPVPSTVEKYEQSSPEVARKSSSSKLEKSTISNVTCECLESSYEMELCLDSSSDIYPELSTSEGTSININDFPGSLVPEALSSKTVNYSSYSEASQSSVIAGSSFEEASNNWSITDSHDLKMSLSPVISEPFSVKSSSSENITDSNDFRSFVSPVISEPFSVKSSSSENITDSNDFRSFVSPVISEPFSVKSSSSENITDSNDFRSFVFPVISEPFSVRSSSSKNIPDSIDFRSIVSPVISKPFSAKSPYSVNSINDFHDIASSMSPLISEMRFKETPSFTGMIDSSHSGLSTSSIIADSYFRDTSSRKSIIENPQSRLFSSGIFTSDSPELKRSYGSQKKSKWKYLNPQSTTDTLLSISLSSTISLSQSSDQTLPGSSDSPSSCPNAVMPSLSKSFKMPEDCDSLGKRNISGISSYHNNAPLPVSVSRSPFASYFEISPKPAGELFVSPSLGTYTHKIKRNRIAERDFDKTSSFVIPRVPHDSKSHYPMRERSSSNQYRERLTIPPYHRDRNYISSSCPFDPLLERKDTFLRSTIHDEQKSSSLQQNYHSCRRM